MISHWKSYWPLLDFQRRGALRAIVATTASGLSEGIAILALIPLLHSGQRGVFEPLLLVVFLGLGLISIAIQLLAHQSLGQLQSQMELTLREQRGKQLLHRAYLASGKAAHSLLMDSYEVALGFTKWVEAFGLLLSTGLLLLCAFVLFPTIAIVILIASVLVVVGYSLGLKKTYTAMASHRRHLEQASQATSEIVQGFRYLKATAQENQRFRALQTSFQNVRSALWTALRHQNQVRSTLELAALSLVGAVLYYGLKIKSLSLTELLVFLGLFYRCLPRLTQFQTAFNLASLYRPTVTTWISETQKLQTHSEKAPLPTTFSFEQRLELASVSFSYPDRAPLFQNLNFTLAPRESLLIFGESGVGKSTLLLLLSGLLSPTKGRIYVDGIQHNLDHPHWKEKLGVVFQAPFLFRGTIAENIALGDPHPNLKRLRHCADQAHATPFITELPNGIDTPLRDGGSNLSMGQRQRIALARALYRDPWLLLLDEPTSGLDDESQKEIQSALNEIQQDRAIVITSHRKHFSLAHCRRYELKSGQLCEAKDGVAQTPFPMSESPLPT